MEKLKDSKSHKVCFSANAQGEPTKIQRTLFAEVFYVMAMAGLAKVTNENIYKVKLKARNFGSLRLSNPKSSFVNEKKSL